MPIKNKFDKKVVNTLRTLSIDAVQKANSGHPGTPMALAPVAYELWRNFIKFNPKNPEWINRDRFVLSAGHASMLLYGILFVSGFDLDIEDIKSFRQLNSKCPGHPEFGHTPGVETTTGPLGQGAANSVGMAIAEKWLKERFNKEIYDLIDYNVYSIMGDGCIMEGITSEAASLAGHLGLNNLIWIYDSNRITIEGKTDLAFSEDVATRFLSYNWHVQRVGDANDLHFLNKALNNAKKEKNRPSIIIVDSLIGYGSPNKQDTASAHGAPLGEEEIKLTKEFLGCDPEKSFYIPEEVEIFREEQIKKGKKLEENWKKLFDEYKEKYPELAHELMCIKNNDLPKNWQHCLPFYEASEKGISTRAANGEVLNFVSKEIPWLIGGSADLGPSTKTFLKGEGSFGRYNYQGKNIHYGIRENAMAAIANGISLSHLKTFVSTFLVFSDYLRPSMRMSALMDLPVIYIFTHDSVGVGEDGPTHQPIEHIASIRSIPRLELIRPADANEISELWEYIMLVKDHPIVLILSRQNIPIIDRKKYTSAEKSLCGGYIVAGDEDETPDIILIGTGSEVNFCIKAYEKLQTEGINARVVSMPSWYRFERQSDQYKESVLPKNIKKRIAVEAATILGWHRYIGEEGEFIGIKTFGLSAPISDVLNEIGITVDKIVEKSKIMISK